MADHSGHHSDLLLQRRRLRWLWRLQITNSKGAERSQPLLLMQNSECRMQNCGRKAAQMSGFLHFIVCCALCLVHFSLCALHPILHSAFCILHCALAHSYSSFKLSQLRNACAPSSESVGMTREAPQSLQEIRMPPSNTCASYLPSSSPGRTPSGNGSLGGHLQ